MKRILCTGKSTADGWELSTGTHPLPPAAQAAAQNTQPAPTPEDVERYVMENIRRVDTGKENKGK